MKEKDIWSTILWSVKLIFKIEGEIKNCWALCITYFPSYLYMASYLIVLGFPEKSIKSFSLIVLIPNTIFMSPSIFLIALPKNLRRMMNNIGDEGHFYLVSIFSKIIFSIYPLSMILALTLQRYILYFWA